MKQELMTKYKSWGILLGHLSVGVWPPYPICNKSLCFPFSIYDLAIHFCFPTCVSLPCLSPQLCVISYEVTMAKSIYDACDLPFL